MKLAVTSKPFRMLLLFNPEEKVALRSPTYVRTLGTLAIHRKPKLKICTEWRGPYRDEWGSSSSLTDSFRQTSTHRRKETASSCEKCPKKGQSCSESPERRLTSTPSARTDAPEVTKTDAEESGPADSRREAARATAGARPLGPQPPEDVRRQR